MEPDSHRGYGPRLLKDCQNLNGHWPPKKTVDQNAAKRSLKRNREEAKSPKRR